MQDSDNRVDFLAEDISLPLFAKIIQTHWRGILFVSFSIGAGICFMSLTRRGIDPVNWLTTSVPGLTIVGAAFAATHGVELLIITPLTWLIKRYLRWVDKRRMQHPVMAGVPDGLSIDNKVDFFPAWRKVFYWFGQATLMYSFYGVYLGIRANGLPLGGYNAPLFSALTSSWIGQAWVYPLVATIPIFYVERFLTLSPRYEEGYKQAGKVYNRNFALRIWLVLIGVIIMTELAALMT
jgi:hypothetical protein